MQGSTMCGCDVVWAALQRPSWVAGGLDSVRLRWKPQRWNELGWDDIMECEGTGRHRALARESRLIFGWCENKSGVCGNHVHMQRRRRCLSEYRDSVESASFERLEFLRWLYGIFVHSPNSSIMALDLSWGLKTKRKVRSKITAALAEFLAEHRSSPCSAPNPTTTTVKIAENMPRSFIFSVESNQGLPSLAVLTLGR
jgi:hypothetical protein